jgi:pyruvate formate lyase activating enzyme
VGEERDLMRIGGFQPVDLVNFPSVVAATVFTMGCDCRCPYCHNPTLVRAEEPPLSEEDVVGWLRERKIWSTV